jgi:hypothetical protein
MHQSIYSLSLSLFVSFFARLKVIDNSFGLQDQITGKHIAVDDSGKMSSSKAIQTFVRERPSNGKDGILDPPSLELDEIAKTATAYSDRGKASEIK